MYSYFKGCVTEIFPTHIIFEVANIGYKIKVANPFQYIIGTNLTLYLHHHIREDNQELYGFTTIETRDLFETLINVKGLGPKGALAILATSSYDEIVNAINQSQSSFFTQFPGIGQKLSQQIILDLKGKINFCSKSNDFDSSEKLNNVILALKSLGYSSIEIKNVVKDLIITEDSSISELVKSALKKLKLN